MKLFLDGILVVEGKEDASYLSNYIETEIVVVNGFELDPTTISYLNNKRIIALLDPDDSGKQIRKSLNKVLSNIVNVEIDINKCIRGSKNGVAECEINEILHVLNQYAIEKREFKEQIKQSDLYELGLIGDKEKREFVCQKLNLGKCNSKQLYKRLMLNNITYENLCEKIKEYRHGN